MVGVAPFVGREAEQRAIALSLARAAASSGVAIVLTGAAGIGKTRLAEEAAAAAAPSFELAWATCGPARTMPPFWPWTQLLGDLFRGHADLRDRAEREWPAVARLVDARGVGASVGAAPDHEQARAELYQDVVSLLAAAAAARPLLLLVDDLHNADAASWLLLAHVASRLRALPVAVLATWRTGEAHRSEPSAAALLRQVQTVVVPPLDAEQMGSLIDGVTGGPVDAAVAAAVHRRTSGNPLLAQEVLAGLGARGGLGDASAVATAIPETTRALVGERLAGLPAATRSSLAAAAAFGTRFPLDVLGEAVGQESIDVLETLSPAVAAGVLGALGPTTGVFAHDVVRDVVFDSESPAARARIHRLVGEALERLRAAGRAVEPVDLARHYLAGGPATAAQAVAYAREAGERAMAMLAYEDAAAWLARAVEAMTATAADPAARSELLLALGEAHEAAGDRARARATYLEAADAARASGRPDLLATAALGMSGTVGFEVTLLDQGQIDLLREALAALPAEAAALRASVMARLAVAVSFLADAGERLRLSDDAVALARSSGDQAALVQALAARCDTISGPEHIASRLALASEIVDVAAGLRDPRLELLGRRLLVVALLEQGDVFGADRQIRAFTSTALALRRPVYSWYVPLWRSMRAAMEGRIDDARAALAEAERWGAESDSDNAVMLVATLRWHLASEEDDREAIAGMLAGAGLEDVPGVWPIVARALCAAQIGRQDAARSLLDLAAAALPGAERDSEWLPMLAQAAEAVGLLGGHPLAAWLYGQLLPFRSSCAVEGIGAAVRAPVERALGTLAASLGRKSDATAHFDAAVAACERMGASALVARTLRDAGVGLGDRTRLQAARRRYQALGMDRRVAELDGLLGGDVGGAPPPLAEASDNVFRREGDVWRLAHAGREVRLRDSKGLRDLARLLAEPSRPFPAVALAGAGGAAPAAPGELGLHAQGDLGELVDARAREAYRRRLAELEEEIDDADRAADVERSARAVAEKDALVAQLAAAYGLGGRPRRAGDPAERARQTVTARIRESLARIESAHPELGRHLRRSVRTGRICVYEPDTPIDWTV